MSDSSPVSIEAPCDPERCQHLNARGQRCRMLAYGQEGLCPYHLNRLQAGRARHDEAVAAALFGPLEDFGSPASVNFFLGNLLKQLARRRLDRRDAIAQAYICQLLLNTFPLMHRQLESDDGPEACQRLLDAIANLQEPPQEEPDSGDGFTPSDGADDGEILPAEAAIS